MGEESPKSAGEVNLIVAGAVLDGMDAAGGIVDDVRGLNAAITASVTKLITKSLSARWLPDDIDTPGAVAVRRALRGIAGDLGIDPTTITEGAS